MKKRISIMLAVILTLSIVSSLGINIAAGIIETPIIPILPSKSTEVEFTSSVGSSVLGGSTVSFETAVDELPTSGITSIELVYTYSDGLVFNGDVKTSGIPSGFEISDYTDKNNKITFEITGSKAVKTAFAVSFSFDVPMAADSSLSVKLSSITLTDGNGSVVYDVVTKSNKASFSVESVIPAFEHLGASLRINNTPALRYGMKVSRDAAYEKFLGTRVYSYSDNAVLKFGMLYIQETALVGELEVGTSGAHVEIFKSTYSDTASEIIFTYTVENFFGNNTNFVTRPFVVYEGDGEPVYFYGEAKVRSAAQVAEAELAITTDAKKKELLNKFIAD